LRLEWRPRAIADLEHLRARIALDQPAAAMRVAASVLRSAELLRTYPRLGRVGRARNTRELAVAHTPYLLIYRYERELVSILRLLHGAQDWPTHRSVGS
jgi:toxin ParE1/3/4